VRAVQIVDDFEDNDISEYDGDTGAFSVVTSPVQEGTYALQADNSRGNTITSQSGLANYPSRGDTFRYWLYIPSADSSEEVPVTQWAKQDADNHYRFDVLRTVNDIRLGMQDGGTFTALATTTYSFPSDTWMQVEIDFQSTITCRILDSSDVEQASISATDGTFDSGNISFYANGKDNDEVAGVWDYWRII
jgi:hypothetical protein